MIKEIIHSPLIKKEFFTEFKYDILQSLLSENAYYSIEEIISWYTTLKTETELSVEPCHVSELDEWILGIERLYHKNNKYFEIIGVEIEAGNREVSRWNQPLLKQLEEGIVGFIIKKINSVFHILIQAKLESGNFDILEMAPTVQCITGSYREAEYPVAYLDYFLEEKGIVHYDKLQSEEGGRFFQEQNRYMVIEVDDEFPINVKKQFTWMTFRQAKEFIMFNNYLNIEARSLIACISPI